jgi:hypothetical protein
MTPLSRVFPLSHYYPLNRTSRNKQANTKGTQCEIPVGIVETLKHYTIFVYNPGSVFLTGGMRSAALLTERYEDEIPGQFAISILSINLVNTLVHERDLLEN